MRRRGDQLRWPANVFYGWWIVAIGMVVDALKHGTFNRGFTLFVIPIEKALGINRTDVSLAETFGRLEGGIQGPFLGYLTDRLGPGAIMAFGGLTSGLGFILLYFTNSYLYFMLVYIGLLSVGFRAGYNNASIPAVNHWFNRKRSLAMSIVSTGHGLGGAAIAPIVGLMIYSIGWRPAALISGIVILAVVVPLSLMVRRSPESMGLLPDGARAPAQPPLPTPGNLSLPRPDIGAANPLSAREEIEGSSPPLSSGQASGGHGAEAPKRASASNLSNVPGFTAKEAMRTQSYWFLVLAAGLRNFAETGMTFHLVPVMVWFLGVEAETNATVVVLVGLLSFMIMIFTPIVGWLGDKWSKQRLSAVAMSAGALALAGLLYQSGHMWQLAMVVALLAFSESANPLNWAIMGDFFGRRSFATLRGWQQLPNQLISMPSTVFMGWIFVQTGNSYFWALVPLSAVYGVAALFYWTIPRPRLPDRPDSF